MSAIRVGMVEFTFLTVGAALTELETQLDGLIALSAARKRSLRKMGQKSEVFRRQALLVLEENPQMVRANVPLTNAIAGLNALEQLRPRIVQQKS